MFARLKDANLEGADLRNTNLSDANFENANLQGASLKNTVFSDRTIVADKWRLVQRLVTQGVSGQDLKQADLQGANLYYTQLIIAIKFIQEVYW